jgi:hypothetical protein
VLVSLLVSMGKYKCLDCSRSEWQFILSNIVHDEPDTSLFQCKVCKRIVGHYDTYMSDYLDEDKYI